MRLHLPRVIAGLLLTVTAAGCAATTSSGPPQTLTVLAASSLTGVLEPLTAELTRTHPGLRVRVSYASSTSLVAQVRNGAGADVIITASAASLTPLTTDALVLTPTTIATNTAALIVPTANPGKVRSLSDLARSSLRIALCDPSVPCGAAASKTLKAAGIVAAPDTLAPDVKTVLRLVSTGEADAGIVYRTDALAARTTVTSLPLPPGTAATTSYPAAVIAASSQQALAREYVEILRGPGGRSVLLAAGFGLP